MHRLLAKKKSSTASPRRNRSVASIVTTTTPSDLQAEKSAPYKNPSNEAVLEREAGSHMDRYKPGITKASEKLCQTLLDSKQDLPKDTDSFKTMALRLSQWKAYKGLIRRDDAGKLCIGNFDGSTEPIPVRTRNG